MHLFSIAVALLAFVGSAVAQDASPDALKDLAPTGNFALPSTWEMAF
jgi:hypothetical protein